MANKIDKSKAALRRQYFDLKENYSKNSIHLKQVIKAGKSTFLFSVFFVAGLLLIDWVANLSYHYLELSAATSNQGSFLCWLWNLDETINQRFSVKDVSQLAYGITIGASVLGVLLGLFFTTFITIISSKYSNISSVIRAQLLEQQTINYYFKFISCIISISFLFQFTLIMGYQPTLLSCLLLAVAVVIAISSFVGYGKFSLIFYDIGYLVVDLVGKCRLELKKIIALKTDIDALQEGKNYLSAIYHHIDKIDMIVQEAKNPELTNTSLGGVSDLLLDFAIDYNSIKHVIPAKKGWHIEILKPKRWENAQDWDLSLLRSSGVDLLPQKIDDFNFIEKKIISTQFRLFDHYITDSTRLQILTNQAKYLAAIAYQYDTELFSYYFDLLEKFIADKTNAKDPAQEKFRLQVVQLYSYLVTYFLWGVNTHTQAIDAAQLRKIATLIHENGRVFDKNALPYLMVKWTDGYQSRLTTEKALTGKQITSLFYTTYEMATNMAFYIEEFWKKILEPIEKAIDRIYVLLKGTGQQTLALQFNIGLIETCHKMSFYLANTRDKISELNELNWQKQDSPLSFAAYDALVEKNHRLKQKITEHIWELAVDVKTVDEESGDLQGLSYQIITGDLIQKILTPDAKAADIGKYLTLFTVASIQYIEHLRKRYASLENWVTNNVRLFPLIMDILQFHALAIVVGKIYNEEIVKTVIGFWDKLYDDGKDASFWSFVYTTYQLYNQPSYMLSTNSYSKEHERHQQLEQFLLDNAIIRKESVRGVDRLSYGLEYVCDSPDAYIQALVKNMDAERGARIKLDELFIEYFLRTRVSLKALIIEETRYGKDVRRFMERKA